MKHLYKYILIIVVSFTAIVYPSSGQNVNVHVVTKTINKDFPITTEQLLSIKGEKSTISIKGWDNNYVRLRLKLISKNINREKAEENLSDIHYNIENLEKKVITLSNYYVNSNIESILQVEYEIMIPNNVSLEIKNLYGLVHVANLKSYLNLEVNFGQVFLDNLKGEIVIKSKYADITANNINTSFEIISDKADIELTNISGSYQFNCNYGRVSLESLNQVKRIEINAKKTGVNLILDQFEQYNYNLSTTYDKVKVPIKYQLESGSKNKYIKVFKQGNSEISITTTFSPIIIQSTKLGISK